jgi:hypothetical protein
MFPLKIRETFTQYTASYPTRKESSATPLRKPQNSKQSTSLSVCRETRLCNLMCNNFVRKIRRTECLSASLDVQRSRRFAWS